jgi:hypothetical protein
MNKSKKISTVAGFLLAGVLVLGAKLPGCGGAPIPCGNYTLPNGTVVPIPCPSPSPLPEPSPSASPIPTPSPDPSPSATPTPEPSPDPSPTTEPSPTPTPSPSAEPTPEPSFPPGDGCFPPTSPIEGETSCPWGECLTVCPRVTNYGIAWVRVTRGGKEQCRGHGSNGTGGQIPACYFWAEKSGNVRPGDVLYLDSTPRTDKYYHDPGIPENGGCCWYGDGREKCELPHGCAAPPTDFRVVGMAGPKPQPDGPYGLILRPQNKGFTVFACPPPSLGYPGTIGCNDRRVP